MDIMVLRWDGGHCKYNNIASIEFYDDYVTIQERDVPYRFYENIDDIKEIGAITPFTKSYFEDDLHYRN